MNPNSIDSPWCSLPVESHLIDRFNDLETRSCADLISAYKVEPHVMENVWKYLEISVSFPPTELDVLWQTGVNCGVNITHIHISGYIVHIEFINTGIIRINKHFPKKIRLTSKEYFPNEAKTFTEAYQFVKSFYNRHCHLGLE